ncbi:MAG: hypothetical protein WCS69_08045 [Ignavibacteriaceae bacterium]|jgi:exopolyphosphatase/guanosine-5'-triphosphate,3'-diphosphate pyrophosphatase
MNIASIDIGTNTILLLVAQIDPQLKIVTPLREEIRMPRIGKDLYTTGKISEDKIQELENVLLEYKAIVDVYACSECFIIGTHALRNASNKLEIKERIYKRTGFSLEIVPPDSEAEYAFYGVRSSLNSNEIFVILDIGGGSTEIIICKSDVILEKKSIPVGVVTLKDQLISGYPISEIEKRKLKNKIEYEFSSLNLNHLAPKSIIGISGTPTTFAAIRKKLQIFEPEKIDNSMISKLEIAGITEFLGNSSIEEVKNSFGEIISKREDILYIGGKILLYIMDYFSLPNVIVSTKGIRHGVFYKKMFIDK